MTPTMAAALSHFPVLMMDVSISGARIQHDAPLTLVPGKRFVLDFTCNRERFHLTCTVARSRMEMDPRASRMIYTTGVRFIDIDEFTMARLWAAVDFDAAIAGSAFDFQILSH